LLSAEFPHNITAFDLMDTKKVNSFQELCKIVLKARRAGLSLGIMCSMCYFPFRSLLICMPRNMVGNTSSLVLILIHVL
jgi:hypothetical protein